MKDIESPIFWIPKSIVLEKIYEPSPFGKAYERDDYKEHGQRLTIAVNNAQRWVDDLKRFTKQTTLSFEVTTPAKRPIRNEKQKLEHFGFRIAGYEEKCSEKALVTITKSDFQDFKQKVELYADSSDGKGRSYLSIFEDIKPLGKCEIISKDLYRLFENNINQNCMINLFSRLTDTERLYVGNQIKEVSGIGSLHEIQIKSISNFDIVISGNLTKEIAEHIADNIPGIRSIQENANVAIPKSSPTKSIPTLIELQNPESNVNVVVVDTGIADSPYINGYVKAREVDLPPTAVTSDYAHGTFVASRVIFGDNIDDQIEIGKLEPYCSVIDYAVFGENVDGKLIGKSETDLIVSIDNAVKKFKNISRIFNLSLGFEKPMEKNNISSLAKHLDMLSKRENILFVIACGNIKRVVETKPYPNHFAQPESRIQPPAESLLAISVGSYARLESTHSVCRINELSPFSCVGPGANLSIKPELIEHGGNVDPNWESTSRLGTIGITRLGRQVGHDSGTSFAAPLVSRAAARIFNSYPDISINLLKSLLFHFSEKKVKTEVNGIDPVFLSGFGIPNPEMACEIRDHSGVFIYEGEVTKNKYQTIPFYIPSAFTKQKRSSLRIKCTLVFDPDVNIDNSYEYSCSHIFVKGYKRLKGQTIEIQGLSKDSKEYCPIVQFDKLFKTTFSAGEWCIQVRLRTRDVDESYVQKYAIVIEVTDEEHKLNVRKEILSEAGNTYSRLSKSKVA